MGFGTGPGVKRVGKDSTAGKRRAISNPTSGPATPGADGGVKNRGGRGSDGAYPQGNQTRSGASASTGAGGTAVGTGPGAKRVPHAGTGRGSPGAAAPPASARRLSGAATAPQDQNARVAGGSVPPSSLSEQELVTRRGLTFKGA